MPATVVGRTSRLAPDQRVTRRIDRRTIVRIGMVAGTALLAVLAVRAFGRSYSFFDLKIYHGAMVWWASGGELYQYVAPGITLGFTYPPFAALVMLPMVGLSAIAAGWINLLVSLFALVLVLIALLVPIADRHGWPRWLVVALAVPLAGALEPSRETLGFGQVNLLLFALVIADLVALRWQGRRFARTPGPRPQGARTVSPRTVSAPTPGGLLRRFWLSGAWAGAGIGLATAVKLTPALFIIYLMVTKQWRAATTALCTAVGVTAAAFVLTGRESATYFTGVMWQTDRVGTADMTPNQSLAGLLARMYDSAETPVLLWLAFSLVLVVVGLSRAGNAHSDGDELAAFTLVGLTANVVSPISWTHHLVFVIPAVIVLGDLALRRRGASRGLAERGVSAGVAAAQGLAVGLRTPIWFPALTGLRHALAATGLYALFLVSPIWPYEHKLPETSHYVDGLRGVLMENSFALVLIVLVVVLPWRPGAEPAFYHEHGLRAARAGLVRGS
jgi:alpha-1,2-mannosyltransferase